MSQQPITMVGVTLSSGLCSVLFSMAALVATPALAGPTMGLPEVSTGANPYRSFGGSVVGESTIHPLVSVPEGQEFIVTMVNVQYGTRFILQDSTVIVGGFITGRGMDTAIAQGRGRLRIEEGTTLSIQGDGTYFVQGYFVQAGSPYRSFFGVTSGEGLETIFTADADRDFIARSVMVKHLHCDFYIDDALHIDTNNYATLYGGFAQGFGAVVVPAESRFQIDTDSATTPCEYYIEGEYVTP